MGDVRFDTVSAFYVIVFYIPMMQRARFPSWMSRGEPPARSSPHRAPHHPDIFTTFHFSFRLFTPVNMHLIQG